MTEKEVALRFNLQAKVTMKSEVIISNGALTKLDMLGALKDIRIDSKHILVTDENLEKLYLASVLELIEKEGLSVKILVVPASEKSKSFDSYSDLVKQALDYGFDKHSVIFSLGGGVINNLAGFLSSTLYRGIGLVHFPTSLLAQVDAAIDFKQAINFEHGKNLIGSYHNASKIIIDPQVLKTLDIRFIRDGLGESIKHAICQDSDFLNYINGNSERLVDLDFLYKVVTRSVELKLEVMSDDIYNEFDECIKQYGHSVGHAIEHLSQGKVFHGEAIAIGMCVSAEIALILGETDVNTVEWHYEIFDRVRLPTTVPRGYSLADIWETIRYDKHFVDGKAYMGLVRTMGVMATRKSGGFGHYIDQKTLFEAIEVNRLKSR